MTHTGSILKWRDSPSDTHSETEILGPAFASKALTSIFFAFRSASNACVFDTFWCKGACLKALLLDTWQPSRDSEALAWWVAAWGSESSFTPSDSWWFRRLMSPGTAFKTVTGIESCFSGDIFYNLNRRVGEYTHCIYQYNPGKSFPRANLSWCHKWHIGANSMVLNTPDERLVEVEIIIKTVHLEP